MEINVAIKKWKGETTLTKMTSLKMKKLLQESLDHPNWIFTYEREKDSVRVEDKNSSKGITISLSGLIAKYEQNGQKAVEEYVYYVQETLTSMRKQITLNGQERHIFPVIRSTSFPIVNSDDVSLVYDDHTAETRVYYAIDLGSTYRLIDERMAAKEDLTNETIREMAMFNVRSLSTEMKEDRVAGNSYYFLNTKDGYDASRILNESFLQHMKQSVKGTMTISVPHQDVLIIGDIENKTGYDILAQMTMGFFVNGKVPITALSFLYEEGKLEPIFILGNIKVEKDTEENE